jgi:hypothetical protein
VEGYAYLEIHFNQKLQDCEDEFLANPTEENAWEFYDDYVLLYNLRIQGEKALQKLYKGEGIASYFTDFGAGNNLELIDNALTLLEECEFTIDEGVEIPQSVKYASKAVVNCPVNVEVYAPDGTYITTLVDGVESDVTNDYGRFAVVYRPFTGTYAKVICMSQEGDYTFQIQAENDGLVDLELASDKGQEVYEVRNLPVYTQDVISTSVEQVTKEQSYQLTRDGEEVQQGTLTLVTETYRPVSALTLSQDELLLSRGESTLLNVSFDPVDATEQRVQWQSDDPTIATVQDGKVTAQSAGTTTIRCYSMDNNDVIATCQVTVLPSLLGDYADNYTVSVENTADSVVLTLSPKNSEEATLSLADLTAYLAGYTSEGQLVKISSSTGEETQEGGRVFTLLWSEQGDVYRLFLVDQNICPILDCAEIDRNAHHLS